MKAFEKVKKNFGFGLMRLPKIENEMDIPQINAMIDRFMESGFNYFDTAHGYISGRSEKIVKACLSSRYPRESFVLTNKLSDSYFNSEEDIMPLFESQLEACGVDYFDFYLMHSQSSNNYEKYKKCNAYKVAQRLKEMGKVKHVGLSFHDTPEYLDMILSENPEVEVVQIQFNYADLEEPSVQSRGVYEVCVKHNKPVIVMEPVKGGNLAMLPSDAEAVFDKLPGRGSSASYAIRYAAGFENVFMVLSGMSTLEQMEDNIAFMQDCKSLTSDEMAVIEEVSSILKSKKAIACTECRYCILDNHCPKEIKIPEIFNCYNMKKVFNNPSQDDRYSMITENSGKASSCIKCGKCEKICPQHLPIRELLVSCATVFEH